MISGIGERPAVVHLEQWGLPGFTTGSGCVAPAAEPARLRRVRRGATSTPRARCARQFIPLEDLRDAWGPARVLHAAVDLAGITPTGPIPPFVSALAASQLANSRQWPSRCTPPTLAHASLQAPKTGSTLAGTATDSEPELQPDDPFKNLIGGEWTASHTGATFETRNPADTDEVVGVFQKSDADDARQAIEAARAAQPAWAAMPAPKRGEILHRAAQILESRADQVAREMTREEGKTLPEARGEVGRAINILRYVGGEGARLGGEHAPSERDRVFIQTRRRPLGVVGSDHAVELSRSRFPRGRRRRR